MSLRAPTPPYRWTAAIVVAGMVLAACGGYGRLGRHAGGAQTPTTTLSTGGTAPTTAPSSTVWLCRPGMADDPCDAPRAANVVTAAGAKSVDSGPPEAEPGVDCFYVYPTTSPEPTVNSDLTIQPAETTTAIAQASRFSSVCQVWAPMYRQITTKGLFAGASAATLDIAYQSLLSGWQDYLAHDNHGRPVVFIGHSQGSAMLIRLLQNEVDPVPQVRARMISAVLLGGNVTVPVGADVGGSFQHLPGCHSDTQTGCVIAYSSFLDPPPADSLFGRPGLGVSLMSLQTARTGQVLCTNPAALSGGSGPLFPYLPAPGTPAWVDYPGLYTASCMSTGGATWLQVDITNQPGDTRPRLTQQLGPIWGLHLVDVNVALGNLVTDVGQEVGAYQASHH